MITSITVNDGLGDIVLEQLDEDTWKLAGPFSYLTDSHHLITVPAGFVTDGASSPLGILIRRVGGHYTTAAIIHDFLYTNMDEGHPDPAATDRQEADAILYEIMKKSGVNYWVAWGIWIAVRLGGSPLTKWIGVHQ